MELRFSLLLILLLLGTVLCQLEDLQRQISTQQQVKQRYCGSNLASILSTVCKGRYYNTMHKKSEYYQTPSSSWDTTDYRSDMPAAGSNMDYPFEERAAATSLMGGGGGRYRRQKRYGRGVYNECCEKMCTYDELEGYCAAPTKRQR